MSVAPSQLPGGRGSSTVGIFGRRVSTDALLLAGASVVAIILLYRAGKVPAAPALSGGGSTFAVSQPSNPMIASQPPPPTPPPPTPPLMVGGCAGVDPIAGQSGGIRCGPGPPPVLTRWLVGPSLART